MGWTGLGWATPCGGRESVGETDQTARKTSLQIQTGGFPSSIHNRPPDGTKYPPITAHMRYLVPQNGPPILPDMRYLYVANGFAGANRLAISRFEVADRGGRRDYALSTDRTGQVSPLRGPGKRAA